MRDIEEYQDVAFFLLQHPPLDEIGGSVVEVVEKHRYGCLTKEEASKIIIQKYKTFLDKYINSSDELYSLLG